MLASSLVALLLACMFYRCYTSEVQEDILDVAPTTLRIITFNAEHSRSVLLEFLGEVTPFKPSLLFINNVLCEDLTETLQAAFSLGYTWSMKMKWSEESCNVVLSRLDIRNGMYASHVKASSLYSFGRACIQLAIAKALTPDDVPEFIRQIETLNSAMDATETISLIQTSDLKVLKKCVMQKFSLIGSERNSYFIFKTGITFKRDEMEILPNGLQIRIIDFKVPFMKETRPLSAPGFIVTDQIKQEDYIRNMSNLFIQYGPDEKVPMEGLEPREGIHRIVRVDRFAYYNEIDITSPYVWLNSIRITIPVPEKFTYPPTKIIANKLFQSISNRNGTFREYFIHGADCDFHRDDATCGTPMGLTVRGSPMGFSIHDGNRSTIFFKFGNNDKVIAFSTTTTMPFVIAIFYKMSLLHYFVTWMDMKVMQYQPRGQDTVIISTLGSFDHVVNTFKACHADYSCLKNAIEREPRDAREVIIVSQIA